MSNEQIITLQKLYKKHFGKEISRGEAVEKGTVLLRLVSLVYKPMTKEEYKILQQRRRQAGDNI